jgi:hypothetical protein
MKPPDLSVERGRKYAEGEALGAIPQRHDMDGTMGTAGH